MDAAVMGTKVLQDGEEAEMLHWGPEDSGTIPQPLGAPSAIHP